MCVRIFQIHGYFIIRVLISREHRMSAKLLPACFPHTRGVCSDFVTTTFRYTIFKFSQYAVFYIFQKPTFQCYIDATPAYCLKFARNAKT